MNCPECGTKMYVIDSRPSEYGVRRRKKCFECGYRLTTYEITSAQKAKYERSEKQYAKLKQKITDMVDDFGRAI